MYEGYTSGKQGVRVAHMVNLFLVCVLGVYVLTVMFPGQWGLQYGKRRCLFLKRAHTHALSSSRIQVKAENEKLKRQLIAPLRNSDDLARDSESTKSQEKGARISVTGIPKKPRIET